MSYDFIESVKLILRILALQHLFNIVERDFKAYALTVYREGKEKADLEYPVIANHLEHCPAHKRELETILSVLRENSGHNK